MKFIYMPDRRSRENSAIATAYFLFISLDEKNRFIYRV